jgi:hypothetical protein
VYDPETDEWSVMRLELAGNRMRVRRPPSTLTPAFEALYASMPLPSSRPVAQYSVAAASQGKNTGRYRPDNIAPMDLEWVGPSTQSFATSGAGAQLNMAETVRSVTSAPRG